MFYINKDKSGLPQIGECLYLHEDEEEITKEQFDAYCQDIIQTAQDVNRVYAGEISLEETNPQYRHVIQQRVEERRAAEERRKNGPISDQEALDIIYGGAK